MLASMNLFVERASWPTPHNGEIPTPTFVKTEKAEEKSPTKQAAIPHTLMLNKPQNDKPAEEECEWGSHCPICMKSATNPKAGSSEDWKSERQDNLQRNYYPQSPWYSLSYDILDRFSHQYKLEKEWNERMETSMSSTIQIIILALSPSLYLNLNTNMIH